MNRLCSLLFWPPVAPKQAEPIQRSPRWMFRNGTVVNAHTYDAAVSTLSKAYTKDFWASETIPGLWDVQFEEDICVEDVRALNVFEAVRHARFYLEADSGSPTLIYSSKK